MSEGDRPPEKADGQGSTKDRSLLVCGLHLTALWAFAFAQPLFDILEKNPEFFVARHNTRWDILTFAFGIVLIPPLVMIGVEALARLASKRLQRGVHVALIGVLTAFVALQTLNDSFTHPAGALIAVSIGIGALGAWAYARTRFVPTAMNYLSVAPAIFLFIFLVTSKIGELVLPQKAVGALNVKIPGKTPVVLVSFDEFPLTSILDSKGQIDASRYPHFAELARTSTWYRNNNGLADFTHRAIPSILTGRNPGFGKLPIAADQPDNLFTLLGGKRKYHLGVKETETALCPPSLCGASAHEQAPFLDRMRSLVSDLSVVSEYQILPPALQGDLPQIDQTFQNFRGGGLDKNASGSVGAGGSSKLAPGLRTGGAEPGVHQTRKQIWDQFLGGINSDPRSFYFIYWNIPHFPWEYLPSGQEYTVSPNTDRNAYRTNDELRWVDNDFLVQQALARHLLQAGYADHLLGELIHRLKAKGLWKRAMVVITADHGIAFKAGGYRRVSTPDNLSQTVGVPLFVKRPGQTVGRVDDKHTCDIDIAPMIADALHLKLPWKTDTCPKDVVVFNKFERMIRMSLPKFLSEREKVLREHERLFGSDNGSGGLYSFGPYKGLIGRQTSSFPVTPEPGTALAIDNAYIFRNVHPEGGIVPALIQARLTGPGHDGQPLAISVNGKITSVSQTFILNKHSHFFALVPPSEYRFGPNVVSAYRIEDGGRRLVLLGTVKPAKKGG